MTHHLYCIIQALSEMINIMMVSGLYNIQYQ